mmetsp:Transcript_18386/g.52686  ORF Transcript_18386/g.52686 Transcript_18386/m.52686 type:complete len:277 (+) Transcript_18386:1280-2110(+)
MLLSPLPAMRAFRTPSPARETSFRRRRRVLCRRGQWAMRRLPPTSALVNARIKTCSTRSGGIWWEIAAGAETQMHALILSRRLGPLWPMSLIRSCRTGLEALTPTLGVWWSSCLRLESASRTSRRHSQQCCRSLRASSSLRLTWWLQAMRVLRRLAPSAAGSRHRATMRGAGPCVLESPQAQRKAQLGSRLRPPQTHQSMKEMTRPPTFHLQKLRPWKWRELSSGHRLPLPPWNGKRQASGHKPPHRYRELQDTFRLPSRQWQAGVCQAPRCRRRA